MGGDYQSKAVDEFLFISRCDCNNDDDQQVWVIYYPKEYAIKEGYRSNQ